MLFAPLVLALATATSAVSTHGAVATAHPIATEAALEALRDGGTAADAAVAAAFALSVVEPQSSGIGGGGFALVYVARERKVHVLDFREVAPRGASPTMFLEDGKPQPARSLEGPLAVAVPGAVRGYAELARRFGVRALARLVEPAARAAEHGFRVGPDYARKARARFECLARDEATARELLDRGADGRPRPPEPGWRLVRKDLARTLRLLGKDPGAFYRGPLARRIATAVAGKGGLLTEADLESYTVREREPLEGRYRGHRVVSMPPPSAGGAIVIGLLEALEGEAPRAGGYRPERFLHAMIEAEKRLFARRSAELGDPAFVPGARAAAEEMASPAYARSLHAAIGERATPAEALAQPRESDQTTQISVVDGEGNAVALTTTVNFFFGACLVVPGTGILLNDEMDDFEVAPGVPNAYGLVGTGANVPSPGKVPLSSMAPTLVFDPDGRLELVLGAPGGSTIPTTVAQAIVHVVDDGMPVDQAIAAARIHHQYLPDRVQVEPNGLEAATAKALEARGHALQFSERPWGNAQAVRVFADGRMEAASDPRYEGAPGVP